MKNENVIKEYYERNIDSQLSTWAKETDSKTIAMVSGVRRVGKTSSLLHLGDVYYDNCIVIEVQNISDGDLALLLDKKNLVKNFAEYLMIRFNIGSNDINEKLLVVFDEIQAKSKLKEIISILNKELDCRFACTGSALWVDDTGDNRSTPDFQKFFIYPFSFTQFLQIIGIDQSVLEKERTKLFTYRDGNANNTLLKYLRLYLVVGGMPQIIQAYKDNKNNKDVFAIIHRKKSVDIISTYESDLKTYSDKPKLTLYYEYLKISREYGAPRSIVDLQTIYHQLVDMNLIIAVPSLLDVKAKLSSSYDANIIKPFFMDVGILFYYLLGTDNPVTVNLLSNDFVNGKDSDNNGLLYENFVASTLVQYRFIPYFKIFTEVADDEEKTYELDFVYSGEKGNVVLEAKSGGKKDHSSLAIGLRKYQNLKRSYILCKHYKFDKANLNKGPHYIPFYALPFLLED